jgi:poly-gamma-glutamate capsule biosynthesis protein CapA/YwtB (metallophosphatase superfamily)
VLALLLCASACASPKTRPGAPARLWLGGDVHLGAHALPRLPLHGAGVINLEGPIGEGAATPARLMNASASSLPAAGVRVAFVENNHADDDGLRGRERTRAALEQVGVAPAGVTPVTVDGLDVVFMGIDVQQGVFAQELDAARARGDALVVGLHVTAPPLRLPPPDLEVAVELALAHGASVVVAHGSHALGRVERRGERVIAWGLGNLMFDCPCTTERAGLVLEVELEGEKVSGAWAVPISAGLQGAAPALSAQPELVFDVL